MEYMEGKELYQEIVDNTHLDEDKARVYFRQLTSAMSYAHERQVMHRDIKVSNYMCVRQAWPLHMHDRSFNQLVCALIVFHNLFALNTCSSKKQKPENILLDKTKTKIKVCSALEYLKLRTHGRERAQMKNLD